MDFLDLINTSERKKKFKYKCICIPKFQISQTLKRKRKIHPSSVLRICFYSTCKYLQVTRVKLKWERNYVVFNNNCSSFPLSSARHYSTGLYTDIGKVCSNFLPFTAATRFPLFSSFKLRQNGIKESFGKVFAKVRTSITAVNHIGRMNALSKREEKDKRERKRGRDEMYNWY